MNDKFYVYIWLDSKLEPYYVGKGQGDRAFRKSHTTRGKTVKAPSDPKRRMVIDGFNEKAAFAVERFWIKVFGRQDLGTGTLRNKTNGGDGFSGLIRKPCSPEHKAKLSAAMKGLKRSPETLAKMSAAHKGRTPPNKGKMASLETRAKMSTSRKGKTPSPEARAKMSAAKKGRPSPNKGKTASIETRAKMSEAHKGRSHKY